MDANLPEPNPGKLIQPTRRLSLPGFNLDSFGFTLQNPTWVSSTQVEPGFIQGAFYWSLAKALKYRV